MDLEQALLGFQELPSSPKDFGFLPVPKWLRHSVVQPFYFGPWSNIMFGVGCAFTAANMYYCQPLLIQMAIDFRASYEDASQIPTMYQAGYCIGLFFISPLGDLLRRRQLILTLVAITTCFSVGLTVSENFFVFRVFAFLLGMFNVTPQILLPFAADLASPKHRAEAVSILQAFIMLGVLLARVIAGVVAYFLHWRMVYYVSIWIQVVTLCGIYLTVPDQPCKNPDLTYREVLHTMVKYLVTEPQLVQVVLINVASVACWSSFWVTLTFLLGGPPYHYSTLYIGLFGLVGAVGILAGPIFGHVMDHLGSWSSLLAATCCLFVFQGVGTVAAGTDIAAVVIVCIGLNTFRQIQTVCLQTIVFGMSDNARSRLNALLTISLSAGQTMGTSAGSYVFLTYGWRAASMLSIAFYGWQLAVLFLRGPNCDRYTWFGYQGGVALQEEQKQNGAATPSTQVAQTSIDCFDTHRVGSERSPLNVAAYGSRYGADTIKAQHSRRTRV